MDKYQEEVRRRIGDGVKRARKLRGLSQEQLAELAGTGNKHVGQVERAEVNVGIDVIASLARRLSVDVSDLLAPPPDERGQPAVVSIASEDLDVIEQALRVIARVRRTVQRRTGQASK